jgi:hypothetical protein
MLRVLLSIIFTSCSAFAYAEGPVVLLNPKGDDQHPVYVQVIVTACPAVETPLQPRGQGDIPGDTKSKSHAERIAWYRSLGCVDVAIPMEWLTREMTYAACVQHGGWQAAVEFLHKRQDLSATPEVGQIECIISDQPFTSVASQ